MLQQATKASDEARRDGTSQASRLSEALAQAATADKAAVQAREQSAQLAKDVHRLQTALTEVGDRMGSWHRVLLPAAVEYL